MASAPDAQARETTQPAQILVGTQASAGAGRIRFAEYLCAGECAVSCKRSERLVNAIGMAPSDGRAFHLVSESKGIFPA
ncbi:MAG: hypothetical protein AB7U47_16175, partial [Variibacter sp.]